MMQILGVLTPAGDDAHVGAAMIFRLPGVTVMLLRPDAETWRHEVFRVEGEGILGRSELRILLTDWPLLLLWSELQVTCPEQEALHDCMASREGM